MHLQNNSFREYEGVQTQGTYPEPAVRPTPPVDAATVVTSPSPPVTRGEGGII